jgi:3-oxoacyl-[acyl-carrier-protein] synthase II
MAGPMRRVVITGVGVTTPLGSDPDTVWRRLVDGPPATGEVRRFDARGLPSRLAAEVREPDADRDGMPAAGRGMELLWPAVVRALRDAGLPPGPVDPEWGISLGGGYGDWEFGVERTSLASNLDLLAAAFGFGGHRNAVYGASASGAQAIGEAAHLIRDGRADRVVAGGYDALVHPAALRLLAQLDLLSTQNWRPRAASRPFDRERDGFVIGEGAAVVVLEAAEAAARRGARVRGTLAGYGIANAAHHLVEPPPDGRGAAASIRRALVDARVGPGDLDGIIAYGSAGVLFDRSETRGIRAALGADADRLPVTSTKGVLGYLAGASGAVDLVAALLALERQAVPPTWNYEHPDPECDLGYVAGRPACRPLGTLLVNAFGLGGQHVSLVVRGAERDGG